MTVVIDFVKQAKKTPYNDRKDYLLSLSEAEMYTELKSLFEKMEGNDLVEITHGKDEFGRDLVIKHEDGWGTKFVGVIVKKGDPSGRLTGETNGVVNEILEQTREALSNPCTLREISVATVPIAEIRVIFMGRLTTNATLRVEREIKTASVTAYSIGWLIQKFTEHYPEVFFQGKLAEFIKERISYLEEKREFPANPRPLSSSFVSPWVAEVESASDFTHEVIEILHTRRVPFTKLEEIVDEKKRMLLVGDPGSGKSTALAKIALDMFERCFVAITSDRTQKQLEIPVIMKASDVISKDVRELVDTSLPPDPIRRKLNVKVLLVDGLDEVNIDKRAVVISKLEEFCNTTNCGLLLSTRKVEALQTMIVPFKQYELLPFEYRQAVEFIKRLVSDQNLAAILEEGLTRNDLKMSLTPLLLELLVEIATVEKEIPASLAEVYERFTDIALGRYDIARGIESVFEYFIKKEFLAELAWHEYFLKNQLAISRSDFNSFVENYIQRHKQIRPKFKQFLAEIDRAGILRIGETVLFRHRSFLEFFSAFRLFKHQAEHMNLADDVVNIYFDYMWTDVAFYHIGILREITEQIVEKLDKYDEAHFESMILKVLMGRLLQAGWYTPSEIKLRAMSIALRPIEPIRKLLENAIKSVQGPIPTIFTDFFVMALAEYSFGSRTFLEEVTTLCSELSTAEDSNSVMNCLLLLWANRNKLTPKQLSEYSSIALKTLSQLELQGKLTARNKFVSLFVLEHVEKSDIKLMKQIRRKMVSFRKHYPAEVRKLLPAPGTGLRRKRKG